MAPGTVANHPGAASESGMNECEWHRYESLIEMRLKIGVGTTLGLYFRTAIE
jgi:hypothetical protein